MSPCWEGKDSAIIFSWKQWKFAIYAVGFTLGWCPEWTINKIFLSQYWQLYFTAIKKVSLAMTYTDLIHRVSSTKGKQVHADRNEYMTGQSLPPQMGTWKQKWCKGAPNQMGILLTMGIFTMKCLDDSWLSTPIRDVYFIGLQRNIWISRTLLFINVQPKWSNKEGFLHHQQQNVCFIMPYANSTLSKKSLLDILSTLLSILKKSSQKYTNKELWNVSLRHQLHLHHDSMLIYVWITKQYFLSNSMFRHMYLIIKLRERNNSMHYSIQYMLLLLF